MAEVGLVGFLVLREFREVLVADTALDRVAAGGVDEGDAGALEAGAAEAAAVDAGGAAHGFVDGDELRGAAFVVVDAALAALEAELAEPREVAGLPGSHGLADAVVFAEEVLRPVGEARRHLLLVLAEHGAGGVTQEGLVLRAQGDAFVGLDDPGGGLAFRDAQVVVAAHQAARQAAEEDGQLEGRHRRVLRDQAVVVAVAVEHQQVVLLPQGDAGLVEEAVVQPDVFALRFRGNLHCLEGGQGDVVRFREGHHVRDQHGGAAGQAADGQRAGDRAGNAALQGEALLEGVFRAARVIAPIALLHDGGLQDAEGDVAGETEAPQADASVVGGFVFEVNAFVDGESGHQAVLVIYVCADGAHPVGAEDMFHTGISLTPRTCARSKKTPLHGEYHVGAAACFLPVLHGLGPLSRGVGPAPAGKARHQQETIV